MDFEAGHAAVMCDKRMYAISFAQLPDFDCRVVSSTVDQVLALRDLDAHNIFVVT